MTFIHQLLLPFLGLILLLQLLIVCSTQLHETYATSRCRAACLHECTNFFMKRRDEASTVSVKQMQLHPALILETCQKSPVAHYSNCENACNPGLKFSECTEMCRKEKSDQARMMCQVGCRNIHRFKVNRIGSCPTKRVPLQLGSNVCSVDSDCRSIYQKCCPDICVKPIFTDDVPQHVPHPMLIENKESRSLDMKWKFNMSVNYPILFIIQVRTYFNKIFDARKAGPWRNLVTTTNNVVQIDDLQVGRHYQFRLAAVSALGTRGFDQATPPVMLSILPVAPSPPRHLTDGVWSIHANGIINIQLKWNHPRLVTIPVTFYKIKWLVDHGYVQTNGKPIESLTYYEQKIPATQLNYSIQNLSPEKTYKIQVSAVSLWGLRMFESNPNTVFLTTPKLVKSTSPSGYTQTDGACRCDGSTHVASGLDISQPFFTDGKLYSYVNLPELPVSVRQARVEWMPRVCIETDFSTEYGNGKPLFHQNSGSTILSVEQVSGRQPFLMSNLRFNCHYSVRVTPLSTFPLYKADNVSGCFCTPSCRHVKLSDGAAKPEHCKIYEPIRPTSPSKVTYKRISPNTISYNITWSSYNQSYLLIPGMEVRYRVVWGPSKDPFKQSVLVKGMPTLTPRLDLDNAETKVLRENTNWIILPSLKKNTRYIVKIETVIKYDHTENASPEKILYLATDDHGNLRDIFPVAMQFTNQPNSDARDRISIFPLFTALLLTTMFSFRDS